MWSLEKGYQPNLFKFHLVYAEAIVMFLAALAASISSACQVVVGNAQRLRFRFARMRWGEFVASLVFLRGDGAWGPFATSQAKSAMRFL